MLSCRFYTPRVALLIWKLIFDELIVRVIDSGVTSFIAIRYLVIRRVQGYGVCSFVRPTSLNFLHVLVSQLESDC